MITTDYHLSHQDPGHGSRYEQMYDRGYYRHLWADVERPLITDELRRLTRLTRGTTLVDLACGTGRVTEVAAPYFDRVVALDVSEDMLQVARKRIPAEQNVRFLQGDVRDPDIADRVSSLMGEASCMTAFRLFTNADVSLRLAAARFAHRCLRDGGVVVANTHMVPTSPVGTIYRTEHRLRAALRKDQRMFNKVLAPERLRDLLLGAGFASAEIRPYAAFPGIPKAWKLVPGGVVERAERRFGGRSWNQCALVIAEK